MTRALAHRSAVPIMIVIPDDPDALKLIRLLLVIFNFLWRNRQEVFLLAENINRLFDWSEAILEMCGVCYDAWVWLICTAKLELNPTILNCT